MYLEALKGTESLWHRVTSALAGALAVAFRQTNIVWVAFCLGTLLLRYIHLSEKGSNDDHSRGGGAGNDKAALGRDPFSLIGGVAVCIKRATYEPCTVLMVSTPHLTVLLAFAVFLVTNGGIVVGDRSNHAVAFHFAQLLYFSAFSVLGFPAAVFSLVRSGALVRFVADLRRRPTAAAFGAVAVTLATALTYYEHPFLLADNRHYTFYIWKGFFRRHWACKYILVPVYTFCAWALLAKRRSSLEEDGKLNRAKREDLALEDMDQKVARVPWRVRAPQSNVSKPFPFENVWIAGLVLCTALALVPSPLVEPRYFTVAFTFVHMHTSWGSAVTFNDAVLATATYAMTNALTVWVFLFRPFQWPDGTVARFMW
jgi:alpha-1,2-glucosyltransferase